MRFRASLLFFVMGVSLIVAGIFTQVMGVAYASTFADDNGVRASQNPPQPTPVVRPFTDTACLECHTDQDAMKLLAVEREPDESHSEGPG